MLIDTTIDNSSNSSSETQSKNELYEQLIVKMGKGDTQAIEMLYKHSKSDVYGYALSILKNPQNAEDVMQETYVKLFYAAKNYKPQGKPVAWLFTIVRNLALTKLRERGTSSIENEYALPNISDFTENSVDRMVLDNAINGLSDEERQIVMLHSVSGLKHREIAEIIHIPLSTVLSKYRRALSKLKNLIKEETI